MSILDHTSHDFSPHEHGYETNDFGEIVGLEHAELEKTAPEPVSYTHLTLPTIYSV